MVASRGGGSSGGSGRMRSAMTGLDMYKYVFVKRFYWFYFCFCI